MRRRTTGTSDADARHVVLKCLPSASPRNGLARRSFVVERAVAGQAAKAWLEQDHAAMRPTFPSLRATTSDGHFSQRLTGSVLNFRSHEVWRKRTQKADFSSSDDQPVVSFGRKSLPFAGIRRPTELAENVVSVATGGEGVRQTGVRARPSASGCAPTYVVFVVFFQAQRPLASVAVCPLPVLQLGRQLALDGEANA